MSIGESLLSEFEQELTNTRKILGVVPDAQLGWAPHEKSMSLARLASHVAELPNWGVMTIQTDKLEFDGTEKPFFASSQKDLLARFEENAGDYRKALGTVSDGELSKNWTLYYRRQKILDMPKRAILRSVVMNHLIHHRGQLSVYLRLLNIAVPGMYGPSADDMGLLRTQDQVA
jgi:uncharacterized damage-inducible protein DinB